MKALIYDGSLKLVPDYPQPVPGSGEALVRVRVAGICNTDVEITRGYMGFKGVLGHEFVGVIESCRETKWLGKRVVGEINLPCGKCPTCKRGLASHCPTRTVLGILGKDGAFAEYLTLPVANLHAVPDSVSDDEAVFVEPLAAACRIPEQVLIDPKDRACVLGDGKIGLLVAQVLEPLAAETTLVGHSPRKMSLLKSTSLKRVTVNELKPANQFDLVVDCTGSPTGIVTAMTLVRPRGTIVLKTTAAAGDPLNLAPVVIHEVTVIGSRCGPFDDALRLLTHRSVAVKPLISARFPLDRAVEAFESATSRGTLKVLLEMLR